MKRVLAVLLVAFHCAAGYNVINFDSATVPLLIGQGRPAFVRFDQEYAFGEKAEAFKKLAAAAAGEQILIGSVGISTYNGEQNQGLAEKYGYKTKDKELSSSDLQTMFPKFHFFSAGGAGVAYTGEVTFEAMAAFLQMQTRVDLLAKASKDAGTHVAGYSVAGLNVINLDAATFPLLVGHDLPCLVRFDKSYSHGDKADAFKKLAESAAGARLLIGNVEISLHGGAQNLELAEKYGFKEKGKDLQHSDLDSMFPKFQFFPGKGQPDAEYTGAVTLDGMMEFLKNNAKVYFGLKGALRDFDKLASEFLLSSDKSDVLKRAKAVAMSVPEGDRPAAEYYKRHMGLALINGVGWFKTEYDRIKWILEKGKLIPWQKEELTLKANRLTAFTSPNDDL